jgi:glycosyltransferase involved in cell wall biosynthesis
MIVQNYYPQGEVRVMREAEVLVRHGYEVDVICLRLPGEQAVDSHNGVTVYRLPLRRIMKRRAMVQFFEYIIFFLLAFLKLTALHYRRHYTSVQAHNLPDFLVFAALAPKLSGVPVLLDLHDLMPEFYAARFQARHDNLMIRLVKLQERWSCRFADHVITVTEHWRQSLIKRHLPPEKCTVLMNLADDRIFNTPKPIVTQPDGASGRFELFYHGALFDRYGLDLILAAMVRLLPQIPELHLTLIGKGPYRDTLAAMIKELGLVQAVTLEPYMMLEELPARIIQADLAIVPYRDDVFTQELLPTKLLEYAALGIPTVVSRTMAISVHFDETMVKFFEPGNVEELAACILAFYQDRALLAHYAANIQRFNQRYNWPRQSQAYLQLLDNLTKHRYRVRQDYELQDKVG